MSELNKTEQKAIIKEAIQEWLDTKYTEFGKWTLHGIVAAGLAAGVYFLMTHGWLKP